MGRSTKTVETASDTFREISASAVAAVEFGRIVQQRELARELNLGQLFSEWEALEDERAALKLKPAEEVGRSDFATLKHQIAVIRAELFDKSKGQIKV